MRPDTSFTLRGILRERAGAHPDRSLYGYQRSVRLGELASASLFGNSSALSGRNVLLAVADQFVAACALIELDGLAARVVVCPPGVAPDHVAAIATRGAVDVVVGDTETAVPGYDALVPRETPYPEDGDRAAAVETEWCLLTSGTTGVPKLVSHTLRGLTGAIVTPAGPAAPAPMWATFYDIRRYGGLQIYLRALLGTGSMVLPGSDEPLSAVLERFGSLGVTNVSGTPSHWRRVLMHPAARAMSPAYVRLSGEIADQAVLDALAALYPDAKVGHAYASTEAGVAFEVTDGREGFPATLLNCGGPVEMTVMDDTLRVRSARTASRYVGTDDVLKDSEGFVDTGDIVVQREGRCFFAGRRGGIINIGGQKVHPEEIEAVINGHGAVRMSLVRSRRNPITGAIVAADVVLTEGAQDEADRVRQELQTLCRETLPAWKVPATIRFVPALEVTAAGKLARTHA